MKRILAVEPALCAGCSLCALACSMHNFGEFNPLSGYVTVTRDDFNGIFTINFKSSCHNCHQCAGACPTGALRSLAVEKEVTRNEE